MAAATTLSCEPIAKRATERLPCCPFCNSPVRYVPLNLLLSDILQGSIDSCHVLTKNLTNDSRIGYLHQNFGARYAVGWFDPAVRIYNVISPMLRIARQMTL